MRGMLEEVLQAAYEHGIHIACTTFDGQWIKLLNRYVIIGRDLVRNWNCTFNNLHRGLDHPC